MIFKLSILIAHLESREDELQSLLNRLLPQLSDEILPDMQKHNLHWSRCAFRSYPEQDVELIIETDNGEMTVGEKRNILLGKANGEYVCFVDDDDMVPDYYVGEILKAIVSRNWYIPEPAKYIPCCVENVWPHVIGLKGHYTVGDGPLQTFIHSIRYKEWKTVDGIHQRCPNHLNPVRRELALKAGFTEKDHGEDMDYSMALLPMLKTEVFVDKVMYYYRK